MNTTELIADAISTGLLSKPTAYDLKENPRALEIYEAKIHKLAKFAELLAKRNAPKVEYERKAFIEYSTRVNYGNDVHLEWDFAYKRFRSDAVERDFQTFRAGRASLPAEQDAERKVYICTNCDGVYTAKVTQCDCMPEKQEFHEGHIVIDAAIANRKDGV
jgi:hypothetical protein